MNSFLTVTLGASLFVAASVADRKNFWRSDYYGARANAVLSRSAFVIEKPGNNSSHMLRSHRVEAERMGHKDFFLPASVCQFPSATFLP